MRILKCIVSILLTVVLLLLAISTIRIVISNNPGSSLSFYTFMDFLQSDLDFDASAFFEEFYKSMISFQNAIGSFSSPPAVSATGILVIDKIFSYFVAFGNFVINLGKGLFSLVYAPFKLLSVVVDFVKFIFHILEYLLGMTIVV